MTYARVSIYEVKETLSGGRESYALAETPTYVCYAEVRELYGKELYDALELGLKETAVFRVRFCRKVKEICRELKKYRVIYDGLEYNLYAYDSGASDRRYVDLKGSVSR